ncbi:LysR family transcriptional regulator [Pelagibius litoralis]|uniref:LysR family transcriptional regulator n=1 Tax=Pelagibius litoralis TaxID=374515 RepID=A0A967F0W1_9PROT|nr:LysR substrate-binding domain-containing protein [Pelagibius litoralis]NIA71017.1 LysR family transcriptional regulator [Pelagibius litoralis]
MNELARLHLNGLRALEAAGRLGSLTAAAAELGVSLGAVSQQVLKAEAQLGQAVFVRSSKGLQPTAFGHQVLPHLNEGFRHLAAAAALSRAAEQNSLTVSVAPVLAAKWLVPRLNRFTAREPDLKLRIEASIDLADLDHSDVDVAVRIGKGGWPGVTAAHLLDHKVFPVCSPALAEKLTKPEDLAGIPVIRDNGAMFTWDAWLAPEGHQGLHLSEGPVYSDAALCLQAAIAGQGVFLAWPTLAHYAIASRQLVAPFPGRHRTGFAYWLVTSAQRPKSAKLRAFEAWLREEFAAFADEEESPAAG